MKKEGYEDYILFFTATILDWIPLLDSDKYKDIIINSLRYLTKNNKAVVYAFVIMPNHIHLVWKIIPPSKLSDIQRDFLKFTSQQIKFDLRNNNKKLLGKFFVGKKDREYQFWQKKPLSVRMPSQEILEQKIIYIHNNPITEHWKLVNEPEEYKYSSARFYDTGIDNWGFLTEY